MNPAHFDLDSFRWTMKFNFLLYLFSYHILWSKPSRVCFVCVTFHYSLLSLLFTVLLFTKMARQRSISWQYMCFLAGQIFSFFHGVIFLGHIKLVKEVVMFCICKVCLFFIFSIELCIWMNFLKCSDKTSKAIILFVFTIFNLLISY